MNYSIIRVDAERVSSNELRALFQMDVMTPLLEEAFVDDGRNDLLLSLRGHSFQISAEMTPRINTICSEVMDQLGYTEAVEFFITNSPELNASAISRSRPDQPDIVLINSGLLERFEDNELRFILGHELGHLISRNSEMDRVIRFIFPPDSQIPTYFSDKIETWERLSELTADRFGFLAMPELEVCQTVFFKLSSGLNTSRIDFDPQAYQHTMDEILATFIATGEIPAMSHPINPVRLAALKLFSDSDLCQHAAGNQELSHDEHLDSGTEALTNVLLQKGHSELSRHRKMFLASAGLLIAGIDDHISEDEKENMVGTLAHVTHSPLELLQDIQKNGRIEQVFADSIKGVISLNPSERMPMFNYMVEIALADRRILASEMNFLYEAGETVFGMARKEIAQVIATTIHSQFVPRIFLHGSDE